HGRSDGDARPPRPLCRRVPLGPRSGDRLEGQSLHGRGGYRKARPALRAEVALTPQNSEVGSTSDCSGYPGWPELPNALRDATGEPAGTSPPLPPSPPEPRPPSPPPPTASPVPLLPAERMEAPAALTIPPIARMVNDPPTPFTKPAPEPPL